MRTARATVERPRFRRFLAERGRRAFDIKRRGIRPLVDIARLFAMRTGYLDSTNTAVRLRHAGTALPDMGQTAENALDTYNYLMEFRFKHHLRTIERAEMLENRVDLSALSWTQQSILNAMFSTVGGVQDEVASRYGVGTT